MEIFLVHYIEEIHVAPHLIGSFDNEHVILDFITQDQKEKNRDFKKYKVTSIPVFKNAEEMEGYFIMNKLMGEC